MRINNVGAMQNISDGFKVLKEKEAGGKSFQELLKGSIQELNKLQIESDRGMEALAVGEVDNLHDVMITTQKAYLSLQLAVQVRNKAIEAYQELMRMQV